MLFLVWPKKKNPDVTVWQTLCSASYLETVSMPPSVPNYNDHFLTFFLDEENDHLTFFVKNIKSLLDFTGSPKNDNFLDG